MRYLEDLERAIVTRFDTRPGRMYGWATVLDKDESGNKTGESIWFHYNDGQFVRAYREGEVIWDGDLGSNSETPWVRSERLPVPTVGQQIAFERSAGKNGDKASPWIHAEMFDEAVYSAHSEDYRVVQSGTVLWWGCFCPTYVAGVKTYEGQLPDELEEDMRLEYYTPDDVADLDAERSVAIPGYWCEEPDAEDTWLRLQEANAKLAAHH